MIPSPLFVIMSRDTFYFMWATIEYLMQLNVRKRGYFKSQFKEMPRLFWKI